MKTELGDVEIHSIADCIARAIHDAIKPANIENREVCRMIRANLLCDPVRACRALWRSGSPEMRASLAARIRSWLHRPGGADYSRYLARELKRCRVARRSKKPS